jgi:hypothetical protein
MAKTFLEITDLPTDKYNALHQLRPNLVAVFNAARTSKDKMALLKETIKFMYSKCTEFEKAEVDRLYSEARTKLLVKANELGIELDERLTNEKLEVALSAAIEEKAAKDAENAAKLAENQENGE